MFFISCFTVLAIITPETNSRKTRLVNSESVLFLFPTFTHISKAC
jgi:hypothetical protein